MAMATRYVAVSILPSFEYLWRFRGHFYAGLQDGDGKLRMGAAAQPQPKVRMRLLRLQLLDDLVQSRHPAQ